MRLVHRDATGLTAAPRQQPCRSFLSAPPASFGRRSPYGQPSRAPALPSDRSSADSRLLVEQVLGDGRIAARGGVGQVEDQGEVQRVGADGQRFVQYPVAADAFEVDALVQQVPLEVFGTEAFSTSVCAGGSGYRLIRIAAWA